MSLAKTDFLRSTLSGQEYPLERLEEFAENGEALEVVLHAHPKRLPMAGNTVWERFRDFFPFPDMRPDDSLGEGGTPLIEAGAALKSFTGVDALHLKVEGMNPTSSFKDRGTLACVWLARKAGEKWLATVSTGNMAHSTAAYGGRAGLGVVLFIPDFVSRQKIAPMLAHGARIIRIGGDYTLMKKAVLALANRFRLRITSGNNPFRVEGYKSEAFEIYEQLGGKVPDFIAIPTSACGHVRGVFKGFRELNLAGLAPRLPRMIVVQPAANSPIVSAVRQNRENPVPFHGFRTVAEALSSGDPPGGGEIIRKIREFGWLAEDVTEAEILQGRDLLARSGFLVEAAAATSLHAVRKLRASGKIMAGASVVLVLTGSGLKDTHGGGFDGTGIADTDLEGLPRVLESVLS